MIKKDRPVKTFYMCQGCSKPIIHFTDGLVFKGNVYVADTKSTGGLVGNNFPEGSFTVDDVGETAYHEDCFFEYVGGIVSHAKRETDRGA